MDGVVKVQVSPANIVKVQVVRAIPSNLLEKLSPETASVEVAKAVTARLAAETAQGLSEDARDASITAQGLAEAAQAGAETAQGLSETARDASIAAQGLAETAQGLAETAAETAVLNANCLFYATKALLDADLAHAAGTRARVTNDSTASNNVYYTKSGASGTGSWVADAALYIPDNTATVAKLSALAAGSPPTIIPGLVYPNYDSATKTLNFNSTAGLTAVLIYKSTSYIIPAGTTVVDGQATTAVQLTFDTSNNTFAFEAYNTTLAETKIRIGAYRRYAGSYFWTFPCPITVDGKQMERQSAESYATMDKWAASFVYPTAGSAPIILENQSGSVIYFRLPADTDGFYVRPESGFSFGKTWSQLKTILSASLVDVSGLAHAVVPEGHAFVANGVTSSFEIIARAAILPYRHIVVLINSSGKVVGGPALGWVQDAKIAAADARISALEATDELPAYATADLIAVNTTVADLNLDSSVLSFVAISDTHGEGSYLSQIITHIKAVASCSGYGNVDFIAHLGDVISGYLSDKDDAKANLASLTKILNSQRLPTFVLRGNHDDNSYYVTSPTRPDADNVITAAEWYARTCKPFESATAAVHDTTVPASAYFYRDFSKQKIRVICLDSSDYPIIEEVDGTLRWHGQNGWGFGARQINWLASEALDLSSKSTDKLNWAVLVLSHMPTRASLNAFAAAPTNGDMIEGVLVAFNTGASYSDSNSVTDWEATISCNFSTQGAIPVLAFVHGHTHSDNIQTPVDLGFPYISTPNSYNVVASAGTSPEGSTRPSPRTTGTDVEDCWDIYTINRTAGTINITRYGAGANRSVSL